MHPCPEPDRATRRPRFVAPKGACDTHAHVFGPADRYPFSPERTYTPPDCTIAQYLTLLDTLGFDRGVIVQGGANGRDNRVTLDGIAAAPDRLRGVAVIASGLGEAALEQLHAGGIRGVRMSTVVGGGVGFDHLTRLADEILPLGWHVMLHFGKAAELIDVAPTLRSIRAPFVLDHMARIAGPDGVNSETFKVLLGLLDTDGCWVKLASLYRLSGDPYPHPDMLPMIHEVTLRRPDRILWGSNWPHPIHTGPMPNDGDLVDLIPAWVPDETARRRMLVDNPAALYGFPPLPESDH
jgi:predicted TIM-barrel fold metal-dependent hydrolase